MTEKLYAHDSATRFGQIIGDVLLVAFGTFMLYGHSQAELCRMYAEHIRVSLAALGPFAVLLLFWYL